MMTEGREQTDIRQMMYAHLLEMFQACGPVGGSPSRGRATPIITRQMDQRIAWLERNSPLFRAHEQRAELRQMRDE